jgi:N-acetyl-anhydromuramyl-L-alanine amidase AmpD
VSDIAIAGPPDMTRDAFAAVLRARASPATPEAGAMYDALVAEGVRPSIFLAFFSVESGMGAKGVQARYHTRNPGNVRTPEDESLATGSVQTDRGVFAMYPTWAAGAADWAKRLTGPKYAGAGLTTVRQVLPKYAPSSDSNDPDKYADTVIALAAQWASEEDAVVSKPAVVSSPSPNKGGYQHAHEARCVVWHITQGTNSLGWLTNSASGASSNYLIARTGVIHELVPPTESAWANGKVQKPNLANPVIARALKEGRNLNTVSISIEHEGFTSSNKGGSLTTAQVDATVSLTAWLCQEFGIAPDQTHILGHYEIDAVDRPYCPGFSPGEWQYWVGRVAARLGGGAPVTPPQPPGATGPGAAPSPPYVRAYINQRGEAVLEANFGGVAEHVDGYVVTDEGVTVTNAAGERYARSVTPAGFGDWRKV